VQESSLLTEVERDFNDIKDDLVSIQAFLKNADTKAAANEGVQTWVKQLREASFRIEDVIDEYIMHEAQKINQSRSIATLQMIPNMIWRYQIAREIQDIKSSLGKIKQKNTKFEFRSESGSGRSRGFKAPRIGDPR
ncbi:disease resistance (CC-NBS-LRR class) family protein, partial [Trifolium pratense]